MVVTIFKLYGSIDEFDDVLLYEGSVDIDYIKEPFLLTKYCKEKLPNYEFYTNLYVHIIGIYEQIIKLN